MKKNNFFWSIFLISMALRVGFVLLQNYKYPNMFGFENGFIASNLVLGRGYSLHPHSALSPPKNQSTAHKMPAYPFILAGFMKFFPQNWRLAVQIFQAFLCAISSYLVYRLGKIIGSSSSIGWISLALFTGSPFLGAYFTYIETIAITVLLVLLFIHVLLRPLSRQRSLLLGGIYGLNLLVYPSTFLLAIPMGIKMLFECYNRDTLRFSYHRLGLHFGLVIGLSLTLLSPWIVRNYLVFHRFVPLTSTFPQVFYIGNYEDASGGMYDKTGVALNYENPQVAAQSNDEVEFFANLGKLGLSYAVKHPVRFVELRIRAFTYFWTSQAFWLNIQPYTSLKFRLYWFLTALMLLGALLGLLFCVRERALTATLFGSLFLAFGVLYSMCIADIGWRFRAPLDPLLLIFCAVATHRVWIWLANLINSITMGGRVDATLPPFGRSS